MAAAQREILDRLSRYVVVELSPAQAAALQDDNNVLLVQKNQRLTLHQTATTNDSLSSKQYGLPIVGAPKAWTLATGKNVRVGVVDTGIDWDHPDLRTQLATSVAEDVNNNGTFEPWSSKLEIDGVFGDLDGIDNDNNGYIDDVIGFDFVDQSVRNVGDDRQRDPIPLDEQGHGTSVAGVIAARANNAIGIVGLAYDARIVTLRAFDATGNAEEDDIAAAIIYAAMNGVAVLNLSFGDGVDSPALRDAISFAAASGCFIVASVGNSGGTSRQYPAGYDDVVAVGATTSTDQKAVFSSTGSLVDIVAPGDGIVTTAVGSRYRTASGTSFAAPLVAAAAAMLIEQRPEVTPEMLQAILAESAFDLGPPGWDGEFGAGRLQVDAALKQAGGGMVEITAPRNEQELLIPDNGSLTVQGSAYATLFDWYEVYTGRGIEPQSWTKVNEGASAIVNDVLATIPRSQLTDGNAVVRLVVQLKTGRTLESRKRIRITNSDTLRILSAELVPAWDADRRASVLTVQASRPIQLMLVRTPDGYGADTSIQDLRFTATQSVLIPSDVYSATGTVKAILRADNGDTISWTGRYDMGTVAAPTSGFSSLGTAGFSGYVLDKVADVRRGGAPQFVMSDLSDGGFGALSLVEKIGFNYVTTAQTPNVWIPRGLGDANGNGLFDVFAHVVDKAVLFEQQEETGSPFASVAFADTLNGHNAAAMADVDGDGREDLVMISDSGCVVTAWKDGAWRTIGSAANTTPPRSGNLENRVDEVSAGVGDVDGDGNIEVAFGDTDGDLVICEYRGAGLVNTFTFESEGLGGSGYVTCGDVNNDGKADVLFGVPDDPYAGDDGEYGRQTWTYHLFVSRANDQYERIWTDRVYGVRYGIGYRNGVACGNVDLTPGDEVIICAFPELYVFTWRDGKGMIPLWYQANVVSPRFLTYDFNNNGIRELGYGITSESSGLMMGFNFSEYSAEPGRLQSPCGLRAELADSTTIRLQWFSVPDATQYHIFYSVGATGFFRALDTTTSTVAVFDTLRLGTVYQFRVSAVSADGSWKESQRSAIVEVATGEARTVVEVLPNSIASATVATGVSLTIRYSGAMPENAPDPAAFRLTSPDGAIVIRARSVSLAGDSTLVVGFDPSTLYTPFMLFVANSVRDRQGIYTEPSTAMIEVVETVNTKEFYLSRLTVASPAELLLEYSLPIGASALAIASYHLSPTGNVVSVEQKDERTVLLRLSTSPPLAALGSTYALTVTDVTSSNNTPITTGAGNTLSFVLTSEDLNGVFVYPQPAYISRDGGVTFANLTTQAEVEILDQRFATVRTIRESDGNGGVTWDLLDNTGTVVPPGMYFFRVRGENSAGVGADSGLGKLVIRR